MPTRIETWKLPFLRFLAATVLGALGLSLFAPGAVRTPRPPDPELRIAVNATTIESFPVFVAGEALSAAKGDRIQLVAMPNGRAAMAQLASGAADAATGSETQALLNSVDEPRIRIVITLAECRYRIVARRSAGIRRVSDLRGKKIAATTNTSSQYYLAEMLRTAGIEESDIQLVHLEGQAMPAALESGLVDAVSIWEPHAQNSLEILGKDAVMLEDQAVYMERFNLNTRADVLADPARRLALMHFLQAIIDASARLRSRPAELIPSLAPRIGLPERTVSAVWPRFRFPASLSSGLQASLSKVETWVAATQQRTARSSRELTSLMDSSLLVEAQRRGVTIR